MPTDTSVKLPGGEMCPGGICNKAQTLIRTKFNPTKKRYNLGTTTSIKKKIMPNPDPNPNYSRASIN